MSREQFIFTEKFPQKLYRHVVFWLVFYLFSLLTYFHDGLEKIGFKNWAILEMSEDFFHVLTQILFCYAVLYLLYPFFLQSKKYIAFIAGLLILGTGIFWLYFFEHIVIFKSIHAHVGMPFRPHDVVYWFTMISLFTYFPLSTGLAVAIKVLKNFYIKQQQNQSLSRENANAELQLLKAQVHPHFLFNTLNNIYSFTLTKSMQAPKLVMNLSDTLSYMINDCETNLVLLEKEIKMMNDYIELEKVRYGNRLELKLTVEGDTTGKLITPLLMIPFIENSFKHGASKMLNGGWIHMSIQADDNILHFTIVNGKPAYSDREERGGIGLSNVKKRLALLYPFNHLLKIDSTDNTFSVSLQIPVSNDLSVTAKNNGYTKQ